jgi:hypothetical protein
MNLKRKKTIIITSIITGTCILAGSAFANYSTANGYDVYKKGIKSLIGQQNYTLNASATIIGDGETLLEATLSEKYDRNGEVILNRAEKTKDITSDIDEHENREIIQGGKRYYYYSGMDKDWVSYNVYEGDTNRGALDMIAPEDKDTADKVVRFVELLTDTVVGDLKNNFVYIFDTENGGAKYSISLDSIQIPELINAGISAMCSLNKYDMEESDYYNSLEPIDPAYYLYHNAAIKSVSSDFEVDGEGRLTNNVITVSIESEDGHSMEMKFELKLSDFGTTVPEAMDPNVKVKDLEVLDTDEE